jgi:hypothetical protein
LICRTDQNLERFIGYLQKPERGDEDARPNARAQGFTKPAVTRDFSHYPKRA